jgi:hypothetical protein
MVGALMHMASMPRALIFLALDRPGRLSVGAGIGFATWILAAFFLVPSLGAFGAVYALLIARAAQAGALMVMVAHAPFHEVGRTQVAGDAV